jgi:hypothetical protein
MKMPSEAGLRERATTMLHRVVRLSRFDLVRAPRPPDLAPYREIYGPEAVRERRFYNIGAGSFRHPAWTSVDYPSEWYRDHGFQFQLVWDLSSGTPLAVPTGTAE